MQDFKETLSAMAGLFDRTAEGRFTLVSACWKKVAGEMLTDRAMPTQLSKGLLEVAVADKIWQRNLIAHSSELLFKLNSTLGGRYVKTIQFTIMPAAFVDRADKPTQAERKAVMPIEDLPESFLNAAGSIKSTTLRERFLAVAAASGSGTKET